MADAKRLYKHIQERFTKGEWNPKYLGTRDSYLDDKNHFTLWKYIYYKSTPALVYKFVIHMRFINGKISEKTYQNYSTGTYSLYNSREAFYKQIEALKLADAMKEIIEE